MHVNTSICQACGVQITWLKTRIKHKIPVTGVVSDEFFIFGVHKNHIDTCAASEPKSAAPPTIAPDDKGGPGNRPPIVERHLNLNFGEQPEHILEKLAMPRNPPPPGIAARLAHIARIAKIALQEGTTKERLSEISDECTGLSNFKHLTVCSDVVLDRLIKAIESLLSDPEPTPSFNESEPNRSEEQDFSLLNVRVLELLHAAPASSPRAIMKGFELPELLRILSLEFKDLDKPALWSQLHNMNMAKLIGFNGAEAWVDIEPEELFTYRTSAYDGGQYSHDIDWPGNRDPVKSDYYEAAWCGYQPCPTGRGWVLQAGLPKCPKCTSIRDAGKEPVCLEQTESEPEMDMQPDLSRIPSYDCLHCSGKLVPVSIDQWVCSLNARHKLEPHTNRLLCVSDGSYKATYFKPAAIEPTPEAEPDPEDTRPDCKWCTGKMAPIERSETGLRIWGCTGEDAHRFWIDDKDETGVWVGVSKEQWESNVNLPSWAKPEPEDARPDCTWCNGKMVPIDHNPKGFSVWACTGEDFHRFWTDGKNTANWVGLGLEQRDLNTEVPSWAKAG